MRKDVFQLFIVCDNGQTKYGNENLSSEFNTGYIFYFHYNFYNCYFLNKNMMYIVAHELKRAFN